jgi:hypothetical protein
MTREFFIAREITREEIEEHIDKRLIGITASNPIFKDFNGLVEYVVDIRIGRVENQGLIRDVPIAQWVIGVINDINIPVILERSEGGQITVVARSMIRLPNVRVTAYSYGALNIPFAANANQQDDGTWVDGFGFPTTDPNVEIVIQTEWEWAEGITSLEINDDGELVEVTSAGWVQK